MSLKKLSRYLFKKGISNAEFVRVLLAALSLGAVVGFLIYGAIAAIVL